MTQTICFDARHELPCRHESNEDSTWCAACARCDPAMTKPADRTLLVPLTYDQLVLLETALEANLYEEAPQRARNNGFALDPDDEEDGVEIDEDDEEEVRYRDTYRETKGLEEILARIKAEFRSS